MRTLQACLVLGATLGLVNPAWSLETANLPANLESDLRSAASPVPEKTQSAAPTVDAFASKRKVRRDGVLGHISLSQEELERRMTERLRALSRARALGLEGRGDLRHLASARAVDGLNQMIADNPSSFQIAWHETSSVPRFIAGDDLLPNAVASGLVEASDIAGAFLRDQKALLRLESPSSELEFRGVNRGRDGFEAVRFAQTHRDREVWARDVVVRIDPAGRVIGFSGQHIPSSELPDLEPTVDETEATRVALAEMETRHGGHSTSSVIPSAESVDLVYFPFENEIHLAWKVLASVGLQHRDDVFVDADSGDFLHAVSRVCQDGPVTGSGTGLLGTNRSLNLYEIGGTHFMLDTTKDMFDAAGSNLPNTPKGGIHIIDAQNGMGNELFQITGSSPTDWGSSRNGVSASYFASLVYDYFRTRHQRVSIDGNGITMTVIVNFDNNFNNAFWSAPYMVFGNGDGNAFSDLAGSFDVTAHEMSHGVTENTANLVYEFESGALNEHFSDAFGVSADFALQPASANWLLGEDVTTPGISGDCLRNMMDPGASNVAFNGQQPRDMSEFRVLGSDVDNGGVHINSGIPNRAFYIATVDEGLGFDQTEAIWYRSLTQYLTRNSKFIDFRLGTIQAANDLFGASAAQSIANAMDAVGIVDGEPNDPPGDLPDNTGSDLLALVDTDSGHIFATPLPDGPNNNDFSDISGQSISTGGRPSFSDDGAWFAWVDETFNIRLTSIDGQQDFAITNDGNWWSVALNADATFIAATTVEEDGTIWAFDLQNNQMGGIEIESQNSTDGSTPDLVVYADVLEFSVAGEFLIYDALSRTSIGEQVLEYWDISLLRLTDGEFFRVFQPLPPGQSVGNPTFGQNNDNLMAFDYVNVVNEEASVEVTGFNFETGNAGVITNNFTSPGRPTLSGDDGAVFYEYVTGDRAETWAVGLQADGVSGAGDDFILVTDGVIPVHFTIGSRPSPILLSAFEGNWVGDRITLEWVVPEPDLYVGYLVERREGTGSFAAVNGSIETASEEEGRYRIFDSAQEAEGALDYRIHALGANGDRELLGYLEVTRGQTSSATAQLALSVAPNPVQTSTSFRIAIPAGPSRPTSLSLYDIHGRRVAQPLDQASLAAGIHSIEWSLGSERNAPLASGIYFARLERGREQVTQRVSVLTD